ncbi:hypothetical protein L7F22_041920 [Adiantum nelumboides]|nr:hypothetical protein [Adiantum nelumboides]
MHDQLIAFVRSLPYRHEVSFTSDRKVDSANPFMMARVKREQMKGSQAGPEFIREFNADFAAARRLAHYVKQDSEALKPSTGTKAYAFSAKMGNGERACFIVSQLMTGREIASSTRSIKHLPTL